MLEIIQLPVLTDNYIYLIHEPAEGKTAVVDPAIAQPVVETLTQKGWTLDFIYNTHHHWDHVGANLELKEATQCKILASEFDKSRIPGIDITLKHGDEIKLGNQIAQILETPGHTLGHIVYYFPDCKDLFCGDTLFSMGCGRLFEGTADQMWNSLQQLKNLPGETQIYCTHEYTQTNAEFALTVEPDNLQLQIRAQDVNRLRKENKTTIPSSLKLELATNPFFREHSLSLQQSINMIGKPNKEIFSKIRQLKDTF